MSDADLERLRNRLSVDRDGTWRHDGVPIRHPRTIRMLIEHLEPGEEGRPVVRVGNVWSYVRCEDTPLVVRDVTLPDRPDDPDARIVLTLHDGIEEPLDPATLTVGDDDALFCRVRGGRFDARFLRAAHYRLAMQIVDRSPEPFALVLGGRAWPLGRR
jgi:hypothetical protein